LAAVREVQEELGGWPSMVAQSLRTAVIIDCGSTRYFVVTLDDLQFRECWNFIGMHFFRRARLETSKIPVVRCLRIDEAVAVQGHAGLHPEVYALLGIMADQASSIPLPTSAVQPVRSVILRGDNVPEAESFPASAACGSAFSLV
jgi:hypothetical protein